MQAEQQTAHEQAVDVIGGRLRSDPSLCARVLAEALEQASELVEFWLAVRRCGGSLWHATIHWATTGACDLPASQLPRASVTRAAPHAASPALAASHRRWMWRCRGRARRPQAGQPRFQQPTEVLAMEALAMETRVMEATNRKAIEVNAKGLD